jgi:cellulose synthase/poly-beta-1,6-N-acetylglucosamine synthase-like glycosyltransferase
MQQALLIISILLFISYAAIIIYYASSWIFIGNGKWAIGKKQYTFEPKQQTTNNHQPSTFLSIIIPARNEEENIAACIQSILNQSYPKNLYEIIVVDDHSTDTTASIVQAYNKPNIKCIDLKQFIGNEKNSYKKKGIEVGISQASGELIITTDADCVVPANWLQTVASFYEKNKPNLIVMPVAINCSLNFIEIFQALDFMTLQGITGAAVLKKIHSMCNGANLAYTKKTFENVNGFAGINTIASGDDMLLMHKIYLQNKNGIAYLKSKEVIVQTKPVQTIAQFFNQRIRWASKADKYDDKRMFPVLLVVYLFNVSMLLLPLFAFVLSKKYSIFNIQYSIIQFWFGLLILKTAIELLFLIPVAKFFNKQKLLWLFPFFQPFHIMYTVIAGFLGKFGRYSWKGRKVK